MANPMIYSAVVGSVDGHLSTFFAKLAAVKKQDFSFVIIAGNLFQDSASADEAGGEEVRKLLDGRIEVAIPTYFALGTRDLPAPVVENLKATDGELCPNLTFLGRKVSMKTAEGFKIVAVGGAHEQVEDDTISPFDARYSDATVAAASTESSEIDILVTSEWPSEIRNDSKAVYAGTQTRFGVESLGALSSATKPRYHFSASDYFYEREPFFQPGPTARNVTRFISMAPFGTPDKRKWIYAFKLQPSAPPPEIPPDGCTRSPFAPAPNKRKLESQKDSYNNFRYADGGGNNAHQNGHGGKRQRAGPRPDECFLCLSNQEGEEHMIGSIGDETYITVAKGPLTTRSTFPDLGFPTHMLIIPHAHIPTTQALGDAEKQQLVTSELQRYRDTMQNMVATVSKDNLGTVTWEISRAGGVHLHWQFLPVPVDLVTRDIVETAFDVEAENLSYPQFAKSEAEVAETQQQGDYLKVMIWSKEVQKEMVMPIDRSFRFDLQFARRVLAKLLRLESREDWKACAQESAEEEADKEAFRKAFEKFDFTLEE